jgi:SAM-dependent methyltransferase
MDYVTIATRCPQCGHQAERAFETPDINRRIGNVSFTYQHCPSCGLIFLQNVPKDLGRYYPSDYYFIARSLDELTAWGRSEQYKLDIVRNYRESGRLVEVGPASGGFAYLAKTAGFQVTVIEMDKRCSEYLRSIAGLDVINSADEAKALQTAPQADVIAMWHVIEHLVDPWQMIEVAAAKLKPKGILVLATPNPRAAQFRLFGSRWVHVDAPRHLWLIPPEVLAQRGARLGLSVRLVTTRDPGSLFWNRFGWQYSIANLLGVPPGNRWMSRAARVISQAGSVLESREGRGSAYTIVLEKTGA